MGLSAQAQQHELAEAAQREGSILFYTSTSSETVDALGEAFRARYPGITVEFYRATSSAMLPRLEAEFQANRVQADVINLSSVVETEELRERGVLASYESIHAPDLIDGAVGPNNEWYMLQTSFFVLGYDTEAFDEPPTSWREMLDPAHAGRIGISDPRTIGGGSYWRHAMWRLYGSEFAEGVAANEPFITGGIGPINDRLISGELAVAINWSYLVDGARQRGAPVGGVFPEEGAVAVDTTVAILEQAPNPNAARLFLDFLLSVEGQTIMAQSYRYPVRTDVPLPEEMVPFSEINVLRFPIDELMTERDESNRVWQEAFGL